MVYSRKKVPGRSKDQPIIPAHGQPKALGNGFLNVSGNPPSIPTHIHASSSSVTDLSLPSHFGPSPKISALEPGLGLTPIVPAQDLDLDLSIALRKGTRACTKHPIAKYISYSNLSDNYRAFTTNISKLVVPRNIQEALDEPSWKLAVFEEMNALKKNDTWEVVDLPREKKVVGCKWVFTIKSKADGSVERYKTRLVAKGFTQTYGIDYQETFAPVAKINSIRVLLYLTVNSNWPLHQLDVKNAFLNGDLEEEVFMSPPPGFEESFGVGKVCKLKKSLYGLKQSPRAWFERLGKVIKHYGYTQSQADHTMFYKHSNEGKVAILIVYVDDIVLTGDDCNELEKLKGKLAEEFEIKDLGALKYFLGVEFARSKEGIFVNQRKYVLDLLDETGMLGCKPAETGSST
ncbi:Retrovirus-related Pol polyprotein from transposon RE1 [Vitis vinifera]|uniref:Retrovirus-related Pol polyprotein from transposon RE1 n=1 Tax=Vitis vinifera TaxID=29760 RepID=A0A438JN33_VITVI|nr:Retrovirus-related Pol polyprotein from transposon RE1 [Vitis vinifera]